MNIRKAYNKQAIMEFIGDDESSIREFVGEFVLQVRTSFKKLVEHYKASEYPELKAEAHYLKTSAGAVGAEILADDLQQLEYASVKQDVVSAGNLLRKIKTDISDFLAEVR